MYNPYFNLQNLAGGFFDEKCLFRENATCSLSAYEKKLIWKKDLRAEKRENY